MDLCECCHSRRGQWYLIDQNAEVTLCQPCARAMRAECDVEKITDC